MYGNYFSVKLERTETKKQQVVVEFLRLFPLFRRNDKRKLKADCYLKDMYKLS